ncbi:MAG: DUF4125 family protein [Demequinaceae bacterium]|nr:DUF4125 family protein [Demequinaceae bacterium]
MSEGSLFAHTLDRAESIVKHEFAQFQLVSSEGGRAACQDDWPMFRQMRVSQFLTWTLPMLDSYAADLDAADASHRNLLTEKYARMMASVEPERYAREIEPFLPRLGAERVGIQERIVAVQVQWASQFRALYPRLGEAMRLLTSDQDTLVDTSFETYLRGELGTYSAATLALYEGLVDATLAAAGNLTTRTIGYTVALAGYDNLDDAEEAQRS